MKKGTEQLQPIGQLLVAPTGRAEVRRRRKRSEGGWTVHSQTWSKSGQIRPNPTRKNIFFIFSTPLSPFPLLKPLSASFRAESVFIRVQPWFKENKKLPNEPIFASAILIMHQPLATIHDSHDAENEPISDVRPRSFAP